MFINSIYNVRFVPQFTACATSENSRVNSFMFQDLNEDEITVLPEDKVAIGRAPGAAKYIVNGEETLQGYVKDPAVNYEYDPERLSRDIEFLKNFNVDTIVDVRHSEYEGDSCRKAEEQACKMKGIKYVSIQLDSAKPPTKNDLDNFFQAVNNTKEGKKVYIHCHAGKDRTGILSSCYLAQYQGMDSDNAFKLVFDNRIDNEHPGRSIQRLKYMSFPGNRVYKERFLELLAELKSNYEKQRQ